MCYVALVTTADAILDQMKDNQNFATPTPELSVVKAAADAFREALAAAAGGGVLKTAEKNGAREALLLIRQ